MKLGNLTQAFEQFKILLDLDKNVKNNSILGFAIKNAIKNKRPAKEIILMIQSQSFDNYKIAEEIIGKELLKRISCIKY